MALKYLEYSLECLVFSLEGHDEKLFTKGPAFESLKPTISITSPNTDLLIQA